MEDIKNEVEAPKALTEKENFWTNLWDTIVKPALVSFWEKNGSEILSSLKTLASSAIKAIVEQIKKDKEQK